MRMTTEYNGNNWEGSLMPETSDCISNSHMVCKKVDMKVNLIKVLCLFTVIVIVQYFIWGTFTHKKGLFFKGITSEGHYRQVLHDYQKGKDASTKNPILLLPLSAQVPVLPPDGKMTDQNEL